MLSPLKRKNTDRYRGGPPIMCTYPNGRGIALRTHSVRVRISVCTPWPYSSMGEHPVVNRKAGDRNSVGSPIRRRTEVPSEPSDNAFAQPPLCYLRVGESGRPYLPWKQGIGCSNHPTQTNYASCRPVACAAPREVRTVTGVGAGHAGGDALIALLAQWQSPLLITAQIGVRITGGAP